MLEAGGSLDQALPRELYAQCPEPACGRWLLQLATRAATGDAPPAPPVLCPCGARFCRSCRRPAHGLATCKQAATFATCLAAVEGAEVALSTVTAGDIALQLALRAVLPLPPRWALQERFRMGMIGAGAAEEDVRRLVASGTDGIREAARALVERDLMAQDDAAEELPEDLRPRDPIAAALRDHEASRAAADPCFVNAKPCPGCFVPITKIAGCNAVKCLVRTCQREFCYGCLGPVHSHTEACERTMDVAALLASARAAGASPDDVHVALLSYEPLAQSTEPRAWSALAMFSPPMLNMLVELRAMRILRLSEIESQKVFHSLELAAQTVAAEGAVRQHAEALAAANLAEILGAVRVHATGAAKIDEARRTLERARASATSRIAVAAGFRPLALLEARGEIEAALRLKAAPPPVESYALLGMGFDKDSVINHGVVRLKVLDWVPEKGAYELVLLAPDHSEAQHVFLHPAFLAFPVASLQLDAVAVAELDAAVHALIARLVDAALPILRAIAAERMFGLVEPAAPPPFQAGRVVLVDGQRHPLVVVNGDGEGSTMGGSGLRAVLSRNVVVEPDPLAPLIPAEGLLPKRDARALQAARMVVQGEHFPSHERLEKALNAVRHSGARSVRGVVDALLQY